MTRSRLLSLATALPPHIVPQSEAKAKARELFGGRKALFDRLSGVFDNAGIAQRHTVAPIDMVRWQSRLERAQPALPGRLRRAVSRGGKQGHRRRGPEADDIDGVVTVSTTGIATPSLDARNGPGGPSRRYQARTDLRNGLRGGMNGLPRPHGSRLPTGPALAVRHDRDLLHLDPSRQRRPGSDRGHRFVRRRGGGGGRLTEGDPIATITGSGERIGPIRSASWAGEWKTRASRSFSTVRSRPSSKPSSPGDRRILGEIGVELSEDRPLLLPPGGVKVIDAIETALALPVGTLDLERDVLRDFGNMSAPTVLFVLERLIARDLPQRTLMTAFGPGFTCAGLLLERP